MKRTIKKNITLMLSIIMIFSALPLNHVAAQGIFSWITEPSLVYQDVYFDVSIREWKGMKDWNNWEVIDEHGNQKIPGSYEYISAFTNELYKVAKDGKFGVMDKQGNIIISLEYGFNLELFGGNLIVAEKDGLCGVIDLQGNTVIPFEYGLLHKVADNLFCCEKDGLCGVIDLQNNIVVDFTEEYIDVVSENLILFHQDGKAGAKDLNGNIIIPGEYDYITALSENLVTASKEGKCGALNLTGSTVIPFEYDYALEFLDDNMLMGSKDGKMGVLDIQGNTLIPFEYEIIRKEFDDLIVCSKKQKYGVIDLQANTVIPFEYDFISRVTDNLFEVSNAGKSGMVNLEGNAVVPAKYNNILPLSEAFIVGMADNNLNEVMNADGKVVTTIEFYDIIQLGDNFMGVEMDNSYKIIDKLGNVVAEGNGDIVNCANNVILIRAEDELWGFAKLEDEELNPDEFVLTIGSASAGVWGQATVNDVAPIIRNDRTMLPARFVAENLGAEVFWDAASQQVIVTKGELKIVLTIGSAVAEVNGVEETLDSPAFIENDRTYTPVRFIAEKLGAKVGWNGEQQKVIITKI